MYNCETINCPFIAYCKKYSPQHEVESNTCVYAEQLFLKAKLYEQQLRNNHL